MVHKEDELEIKEIVLTLKDGILKGDQALLELVKSLIRKVDRLEKEFLEYRKLHTH